MAYLFCLFDAQRGSRRRGGRMNGDSGEKRGRDEIEGGFHSVRSHAARGVVEPDVFTLLHFYLSI